MSLMFSIPEEALKEEQVSSTKIFDGKVLHLRLDEISLPDGKPATREYCHHMGAVCVVPLTDEGEVICVRQYRYPMHSALVEIPAGKLDSEGEIPQDAALRELREETGASCRRLDYLGVYYPSPAILDEKIHIYLARGLEFGDTDPDDDEFLELLRIPLCELCDMILSGEIPDGKTQAAILRVAAMLSREGDTSARSIFKA